MHNRKNKLAIVGIFYDGYYDLWEDFLELFSTRWPNCPYPLYIVNNEKDLRFKKKYGVSVLHAGEKAEYSQKVQMAVEKIEADYYLLLLEDFFIQRDLKEGVLSHVMSYIELQQLTYFRMTISDFLTEKNKRHLNEPQKISPNDEYTLTCQPSIWERRFLKKCIGTENYNAWVFEGIYATSKIAHTQDFLESCRVDYSNPLGIRHGAVQGKMLPTVYADFKQDGYIFKNKRDVLDSASYSKHLRKQKIKELLPLGLQRVLKKYFKNNSVIEKYKPEIYKMMRIMDIK